MMGPSMFGGDWVKAGTLLVATSSLPDMWRLWLEVESDLSLIELELATLWRLVLLPE